MSQSRARCKYWTVARSVVGRVQNQSDEPKMIQQIFHCEVIQVTNSLKECFVKNMEWVELE